LSLASWAAWVSVRSSGFFSSAHRDPSTPWRSVRREAAELLPQVAADLVEGVTDELDEVERISALKRPGERGPRR